jgi:hypothetical protein
MTDAIWQAQCQEADTLLQAIGKDFLALALRQ